MSKTGSRIDWCMNPHFSWCARVNPEAQQRDDGRSCEFDRSLFAPIAANRKKDGKESHGLPAMASNLISDGLSPPILLLSG